MARYQRRPGDSKSNSKISSPTARAKLPVSGKPIYIKLTTGISLGYRQNNRDGVWVVRISDGKGGNRIERLALADRDGVPADGADVLDFAQARALVMKRGPAAVVVAKQKMPTVADALDGWQRDLEVNGRDEHNVTRLRGCLSNKMLETPIGDLDPGELKTWRDSLRGHGRKPATVNRISGILKTALTLAAELLPASRRLPQPYPWAGVALLALRGASRARNVILPDAEVWAIVRAAREQGQDFGLLVEALAATGARISQLARCTVADLNSEAELPFLRIPPSDKGSRAKKREPFPVPIPATLAARLRVYSADRAATDLLFLKPTGERWHACDHTQRFRRVKKALALAPEVTIYALRHSSIVRQLRAGEDIATVAKRHETSVGMIDKHYAAEIGRDNPAPKGLLVEPPQADVARLRA